MLDPGDWDEVVEFSVFVLPPEPELGDGCNLLRRFLSSSPPLAKLLWESFSLELLVEWESSSSLSTGIIENMECLLVTI